MYVKKDLPQNLPEMEKKMTGSELDPMLMNLGIWKTVNRKHNKGDAWLKLCFPQRGITGRKHPQGLAGFSAIYGLLMLISALFFLFFRRLV